MILHTSLRFHWIHDQGFYISVQLECSEILLRFYPLLTTGNKTRSTLAFELQKFQGRIWGGRCEEVPLG